MKNQRKAFTLVEIVVAVAIIVIILLSVFMLSKTANKSSMDAYYEMIAFSLAREPIEVFRGFGYDIVSKICQNPNSAPAPYKVGNTFTPITFNPALDLQYPAEAERFSRMIELEAKTSSDNMKYIEIKVTVAPVGASKADVWMRKKAVVLQSLIMERPKW